MKTRSPENIQSIIDFMGVHKMILSYSNCKTTSPTTNLPFGNDWHSELENHHLWREKSRHLLFLWSFSSSLTVSKITISGIFQISRIYIYIYIYIYPHMYLYIYIYKHKYTFIHQKLPFRAWFAGVSTWDQERRFIGGHLSGEPWTPRMWTPWPAMAIWK